MFLKLKNLWRGQPVAVTLFMLAAAVTVFFAVRMVAFWIYWADPAHRDQALLGWMSPRYVAHSWDVPPEILEQVLGKRPATGRPQSLADIAETQGIPLDTLIDQIQAAIAQHRQNRK